MLNKDRISGVKIYSDEWKTSRLGKFTSSTIFNLVQDKELSKGFMSYVYEKVGEELSGVNHEPEFENDSMRWGNMYEEEAISKFGQLKGLDFVITQQLVTVPDTRYGSTPDALILLGEKEDQTAFNVATVEVKCFPSFKSFIPLALCTTPEEVKKANPHLYWQVIDQMDNCDCLEGYSVAYHPEFMQGSLNVVHYRKVLLIEDLNFLKNRKKLATEKFDEVREIFLSRVA